MNITKIKKKNKFNILVEAMDVKEPSMTVDLIPYSPLSWQADKR